MLENENLNSPEFIDIVNNSLADTLIKQGAVDAGSLFLQGLTFKKSTSLSLKEYSRNYLDALQADNLILTFSGSLNHSNNIHELSQSELSSFNQEIYTTKESNSSTKNFNLYYTSKRQKYFSINFSFDFLQEDMNNDQISYRDYRNFNLFFEGKYDNLIKSIIKVSYLYNHLYIRPTITSNYEIYSTSHTITTEYLHSLKSGIISYQVPLTSTTIKYSSDEKRFDYGFKVTYIPYRRFKYFAPSYSTKAESINEENGYGRSSKLTLSLSNHILFKQNFSTFLSLDYINNLNNDAALDYYEWNLAANFTYAFSYFKGLSSTFTSSFSNKFINNDKIDIQKYSLGLTYSF